MDVWSGPQELVAIRGRVDAVARVVSEYKDAEGKPKQRTRVDLVDVTHVNEDGSEESLETRTLFIPDEGAPATFWTSVRKVSKLTPKDDVLAALRGKSVEIAVSRRDFTTRDGGSGTMTVYKLTSLGGSAAPAVDEAEVLAYLKGKTPVEAARGRSKFNGTPYASILASRAKVQEHFGDKVSLVNGCYETA